MALWSLKGHSFLVVDDFADMRGLVRRMLEELGARDVGTARDGAEAIERLSSRPFDAVLCDYNLGDGRDGQQVLEEGRRLGLLPRASLFVMITAESGYDMVMGAVELEPDAYLAKPITRRLLQVRLRRLMQRRELLLPVTQALDRGTPERAVELCGAGLAAARTRGQRLAVLKLEVDCLRRLGRPDAAQARCREVLAEGLVPWALLALGHAQCDAGDPAAALDSFRRLAGESPACVAAFDEMARCHQTLGDPRAAQAALLEGVARSPRSLARQRRLAEVAEANADWAVGEEARRAALGLGKHSAFERPGDHAALARVLARRGKHREAMRALDAIRLAFPGDPDAAREALVARAEVHAWAGEGAS